MGVAQGEARVNFTHAELRSLGEDQALFSSLAAMEGVTYREVASRRTYRFELDGAAYFAKVHYGVGWAEIFKNLTSLRLPIVDASNELEAIRRLETLDVPTMTPVAYVCLGANPANRHSAIVTKELPDTVSLEELFLTETVSAPARRKLVGEVARLTKRMHEGGINHRDLYICHFHLRRGTLESSPDLYVIDLHRAQCRSRTPTRWLVKDVAGLFFSTFDAGLTIRDYLRFVRRYSGKPVNRALREDAAFWQAVVERASRLYRNEFGDLPPAIEAMI